MIKVTDLPEEKKKKGKTAWSRTYMYHLATYPCNIISARSAGANGKKTCGEDSPP